MTSISITASGIADLLGEPWSFRDAIERDTVTLDPTAASVTYRGQSYRGAELPGVVLAIPARQLAAGDLGRLQSAGWTVRPLAWCAWCGTEIEPDGATEHADCAATRSEQASRMARQRWGRPATICAGCGATLGVGHYGRYCSQACYRRIRRRAEREG